MYWEKYYLPRSLDEALSILQAHKGEARIIAGGTDLLLQLKEEKHRVKALVDISGLTELKQIREGNGYLRVGSLCTHSQLAESPLIRRKATALAEAAGSVGSPQIRNVGTVGGNVVNAQPAADTSVALLALNARATIISGQEKVTRPLNDLFAGVGQSTVDSRTEILVEFWIPLHHDRLASSFQRLSRRKALVLPILNTAVAVQLADDLQTFEEVRIAAGPVAPVPWRAREAEEILKSSPVKESVVREACRVASEKASPRDSLRGSAEYRKEMVKVLIYRAIKTAVERLGGVVNG